MQKTIRMPKELLAKWLAALRSGEYRQAVQTMSDGKGGYCCLGVLQKCVSGRVYKHEDGSELPSLTWLINKGITFGLNDAGDEVRPYLPAIGSLATYANDEGYTFAEIADAIEACAEGY